MKFRILAVAAMLLVTTSLAQAALNVDAVTAQLTTDGYTRIEVKIGPTQAKIEAIKPDGTKLEVIYDLATEAVLKSETGTARPGENVTPGVFVRNEDSDFLSGGGGGDDDSSDDVSDDDNGGQGSNDGPGDDNGGHDGADDDSGHDSGDDDSGHHGGGDDNSNSGRD
ncbi:MAG: hypothetical protein ABL879_15255 [Devosia sp.]